MSDFLASVEKRAFKQAVYAVRQDESALDIVQDAMLKLAEKYSNRVFEAACLTEDYENGFRVRNLGMNQKFIPIHFRDGRPATQFPLVARRHRRPRRAVFRRLRLPLSLTGGFRARRGHPIMLP